jgi:hypothetical protein
MRSASFRAKIQIIGINPYVLVSGEIANRLKPHWRQPIPVLVQVNGQPSDPWHINLVPVGDGSFYLYLHGDVRKASGTSVGDEVDVALSFDASYHSGPLTPLPQWFRVPLYNNPSARENWDKLSPSRQKEIVRYLVNLKTQAAIDRNLEKTIRMISGESGHHMGCDWENGK